MFWIFLTNTWTGKGRKFVAKQDEAYDARYESIPNERVATSLDVLAN